jgi:phenylacetic acid degradation protein paaN
MSIAELVERHHTTLEDAIAANRTRTFHAHWPEAPSGKIYGENANADGEAAFRGQLNNPFRGLLQGASNATVGEEASPYGFALGITYPSDNVDTLVNRASAAQTAWRSLAPDERASILTEALERASKRFFEIGYATQHTTGQGFVMAFQASGPHAFDRALEAVALGLDAQESFTSNVLWAKPMGKFEVSIEKSYRIAPKGINVVIGCSTFPVWNTVPGMFAGLVTGNAVIVKPHPGSVYPIAIVIAELQQTLSDVGLDVHVCQLAADSVAEPRALDLIQHPAVRIVDYTGGPAFGAVVEQKAHEAGKTVFTEKAGVNCIIIDSVQDATKALDNVAFALSLYAGQMCTAPQNIFVPRSGVRTADARTLSVDEIAGLLRDRIDALVGNEKAGPGTVGAIQNPATAARLDEALALGLDVARASAPITQPGFDNARSFSPLVLRTDASRRDIFEREWFGPISFIVETDSFDHALTLVTDSVRQHGALTTLVYTTDPAKADLAEDAIITAGAPVAFNFDSFVWVNQSAAFSDFHGAGNNPAGNASFADLTFVTARYNVLGVRKQA